MIVSMKNIVKIYGDNTALNNLNLEIREGEVLGLLGPNGSGKTTAIHILCGLIGKNSGEVTVFGMPQDTKNLKTRQQMGLVTQEVTVFKDLTAKENLRYFGGLYGLKGAELEANIKEVLEFVELTDRANKKPGTFSGGMQRRLNIACSLVHKPKFLIMDEPTVAIDPQSRNHILESVKKIAARGTTVLYTSHYMEEVQEICSRIVVMDAGRAIASGTVDELIAQIQHEEVVRLTALAATDVLTRELEEIAGVQSVIVNGNEYVIASTVGTGNLNRILETAQRHGGVAGFNADKPNLEDVFLTLTGKKLRDEEA
ncbi:MAG: ABC transporter ATP-binding protein [Defluviitaleaceae bacterium]|nr:ABC transporter ATP-binding protein [Defluviitaleaceae bacterium]